jgi:hypothetical protein
MQALQDLLKSKLHGRTSPKGWFSFNCPMCVINGQSRPDTKHRGGAIYAPDGSVSYHCFNCQYKTSWQPGWTLGFKMKKLMRQLGFDEAEIQRLNLELLSQADVEQLKSKEPESTWVPNWPDFDFDFDVNVASNNEVTEYLNARNLQNRAVWLESNSMMHNMSKRVILPYTYQGRLVGYVARWLGTPPEGKPKYFRKSPSDYVYGLDAQNEGRQFVIVTEGEFDALQVNGVAIMSNMISDRQVQLIEDLNIEPVVVPDRDKAGKKMAERAADLGWSVSFPDWDSCKDINDAVAKYGRLFTLHTILNSIEQSPTKIRLLSRRLSV